MLPKGTKNVLLIIPNLGRGGAQKIYHQQLVRLSSHFNVIGCVFNWDGAFEDDHAANIFSLNVPAGQNYFEKTWYFIIRIIRLKTLKRKHNIDVSISHLEGADYINVLSREEDQIICWIHGTKKYDKNIKGFIGALRMKMLMPLLYSRAQRLVTVSKGIAEELTKNLKGVRTNIQTIYNGFDADKIIELGHEKVDQDLAFLFNKSPIIMTHCRLAPQKNLHALLLIFSQLKKEDGRKLIILGDGELREELINKCHDYGLKYWSSWENKEKDKLAEVYFLGQQKNPFAFLRHASIYIMTSSWEGFPLSLCEAMAFGLPVIAADCFTGPREIISPGIDSMQPVQAPIQTRYGILMPLADASDPTAINIWTHTVEQLLAKSQPSLIPNKEAIHRLKDFTLEDSITQTVNLVAEISR
jgi:glycosyltransferase involved in cell wall biosynthesis